VRLLAALLVAALLAGCGGDAGSDDRVTVRVAAASDLQFAFAEVAELVAEERPDVDVVVTYGSSGTFLQQIVNGAPYDLYLSADLTFPRQLVARGMAEQSDLFGYATGRLVVWTPEGSPVDPSPGLSVLTDERVGIQPSPSRMRVVSSNGVRSTMSTHPGSAGWSRRRHVRSAAARMSAPGTGTGRAPRTRPSAAGSRTGSAATL
jgi:hypothetical protein